MFPAFALGAVIALLIGFCVALGIGGGELSPLNPVGRAKKLLNEMKSIHGKIGEAETVGNLDEVKRLTAEYQGKSLEYDKLEPELKRHEQLGAYEERLGKLPQLTADMQGKAIMPMERREAATAVDQDAADRELEAHFHTRLQGKSIPDAAMDALMPPAWCSQPRDRAIKLPQRLARLVLGTQGKALPVTSSGFTFPTARAEVGMYAPAGAYLFDQTMRWPASGPIDFPKLTQSGTQWGGVAAARTDEGAGANSGEFAIQQAEIIPYEISAYTELTQRMLNRSPVNLEPLLQQLFRLAIMNTVDGEIINGDGVKKCLGITNAASGITGVARAEAVKVAYDDLLNLKYAVPAQLRNGAAWAISDEAMAYIEALTDKNERPLFNVDLTGQFAGRLLGFPVINHAQIALGTMGDVVFGQLKAYVCAVEEDVVIARSSDFKFQTGAVAYRAIACIGGKPTNAKGLTFLTNARPG